MKNYSVFVLLSLFIASLILEGCSKDDPSKSETNTKLLKAHDWNIKTVTVDGVDKTPSFPGLTLVFNDSEITATNGNIVWPPLSTWEFIDNTATTLLRDGEVEVMIAITTSDLTMTFQWNTTYGEGKMASVGGNYVFEFIK